MQTRIQFAHCSDPAFVSPEECEWDGFCSNRSFSTKPTCLDEGYCIPFRDVLTRRECERINEPTRSNVGQCAPALAQRLASTSADASGEYSVCDGFKNKVRCHSADKLLSNLCGICQPPASFGRSVDFPFSQFDTQLACENPHHRDLQLLQLGSYICPKRVNTNPCYPLQNINYPRGFDCSLFATKSLCTKPPTRPKRLCLMYPANDSSAVTGGHCPPAHSAVNFSDHWRPWIYHNGREYYPDFRFPLRRSEEHLQGPPCFWQPPKKKSPSAVAKSPMPTPCLGPAGVWTTFDKNMVPPGRKCHALPVVKCRWNDTKTVDSDNATWVSTHIWNPHNAWHSDPTATASTQFSCPCHWQSKLWHLTKCNWRTCGPPPQSASVSVLEMPRLKGPDDWVSDYQAFVVVGGLTMWMTLDSAVATTWVVSKICFMPNCLEARTFVGAFIPSIPPSFVVLDLFERGLLQIGAIFGLLGHTYVNLAGTHVIGCPLAMGILDIGNIVGPSGFNHTGSIGLGFWEDNLPNWILFMDPALSLLTFLKCGNIFYPIPGCPVPVPKTFQLWGLPWFFPGGLIFKFSFFFGDLGGCFFLKGSVSYMSNSPTKWVFAIPIAIKLLAPSWLFILSDVVIRGQSIHPCMLGICKATIHTGQFSIAGPLNPMLLLLEQVAVAKTCEGVEALPDITWVIMGSRYTMNPAQYVVESEAYGEKECLTAFTPEFQLIPGFDCYTFGDVWIHAFYTIFEVAPLKRVGFSVSDQRYYEKNGCVSGNGQGPASGAKSMEEGVIDWQEGQKDDELQRRLDAYEKDIGWKRYQNWMADISGMAENGENDKLCTELGPPYCKCGSGFRFREGSCVKPQHTSELERLKMHGGANAGGAPRDPSSADDSADLVDVSLGLSSVRQRFDGDGTSAATRFWSGTGGSGFAAAEPSRSVPLGDALFGGNFLEMSSSEGSGGGRRAQTLSAEQEFERRKQAARADRDKIESLARTDRIIGQVEPGSFEQMRFASAKASLSSAQRTGSRGSASASTLRVELSTQAVTSRSKLRELYRNASMVLASWAPSLNVSEEQLKGWWRGESEDFIRYQRTKIQHEYNSNLRKARLLAHSFKVKNLLNKRLLHKVAAQMTVGARAADTAYEVAVANVDGPISSEFIDPQGVAAHAAAPSSDAVLPPPPRTSHGMHPDLLRREMAVDRGATSKSPAKDTHAGSSTQQQHPVRVDRHKPRAAAPKRSVVVNNNVGPDEFGGTESSDGVANGAVLIRRNEESGKWEAVVSSPGLRASRAKADDVVVSESLQVSPFAHHAVAGESAGRSDEKSANVSHAYDQLSRLHRAYSDAQGV